MVLSYRITQKSLSRRQVRAQNMMAKDVELLCSKIQIGTKLPVAMRIIQIMQWVAALTIAINPPDSNSKKKATEVA